MTKLGLFVIVLCALLALTCGSRVVRDAPATPTASSSSETTNVLSDAFDKIKAAIEDNLNKENFDKAVKTLTEVGEKIKEVGEDFVNKIQEKTSELNKKD